MSRAETILSTLDRYLGAAVDLTVFGRAALALGFHPPPPGSPESLDVDVVFSIGEAEDLLQQTNFWQALEKANAELAPSGLYISHLFDESQLVLTPEWRQHRVPLGGQWKHLRLYRLGDEDLFLTKLMRFDPVDLADARFIVQQARWNPEQVAAILRKARLPDVPELQEQFQRCSKEFL